LATSQRTCPDELTIGERQELVFQLRVFRQVRKHSQLSRRPLGDRSSVAQQHEPIADTRGGAHRMDRDNERSSGRGNLAEHGDRRARLAEVETVKRFVHHDNRSR
jgi:hypothetical protein